MINSVISVFKRSLNQALKYPKFLNFNKFLMWFMLISKTLSFDVYIEEKFAK